MRNLTFEITNHAGPALPRMTDEQRIDQLVKLAYGNVHVEHPRITMDFARQIVEERRAAGTLNAFVIR
jgi:hypothetical protein